MKTVRTRFAPSPTGGLHLGGVRTALFSYLFAKRNGGEFVLRIEDTDQSRYVAGAEQYIIDCLQWCGIAPDEGPSIGGAYAPYRQSERKANGDYKKYAEQLVREGHAYYAFDTSEELEQMRTSLKSAENPSPQYDRKTRGSMKNSLTLSEDEVNALISAGAEYVIRIKMPENETISFHDLIRGDISNDSNLVDDKVLLKADGMPTYHLAVVVDDYLMKITHAFRGEEWLPSAPVHIKLWEYLGWKNDMPQWAHLPLILKPDGNGKLSKRDGDRLGFPVFAMDWKDPSSSETTIGFKERGFLPEAFINMLAMLGWHSGTEQELFSKQDLIGLFSIERVHKGGAKFDYEKAKWFNQEWIKKMDNVDLAPLVKAYLDKADIEIHDANYLPSVIALVKDRCVLLSDFVPQSEFFFRKPLSYDVEAIKPKWNNEKEQFFKAWIFILQSLTTFSTEEIEVSFKQLATEQNMKPGDLQLPLRIMLVGAKFGPPVFKIAEMIERQDTIERIEKVLSMM